MDNVVSRRRHTTNRDAKFKNKYGHSLYVEQASNNETAKASGGGGKQDTTPSENAHEEHEQDSAQLVKAEEADNIGELLLYAVRIHLRAPHQQQVQQQDQPAVTGNDTNEQ